MQRDSTASVVKAIGIIAMVVAHAECPGRLSGFIYEWHMPLFFIVSGYFFSTRYLSDWSTFVKKRIKGIYIPFVTWAVIILCLHNLFFEVGLLNEHFGNDSGGVLHPYNWHTFCQRLWAIVFSMSQYDEFICGAYWFFRALLVASISYLILYKMIAPRVTRWIKTENVAYVVLFVPLLLALWKCGEGLRITTLSQGGYRDLMGAFFYGFGVVFRLNIDRYRTYLQRNAVVTISAAVLCGVGVYLLSRYWSSAMLISPNMEKCIALVPGAILGWMMAYNASTLISGRDSLTKRILVYIGDNTLYILLFHVLSYKLVSAMKIMYYHLDWQQIGCHMVVHEHNHEDGFWILYAIVGIAVPLLLHYITKKVDCYMKRRM